MDFAYDSMKGLDTNLECLVTELHFLKKWCGDIDKACVFSKYWVIHREEIGENKIFSKLLKLNQLISGGT